MPRRSVLTLAERTGLLAFPVTDDEFIRHYTFSESDLAAIRQRRGKHNRLGFAVQLCYLAINDQPLEKVKLTFFLTGECIKFTLCTQPTVCNEV